MSDKQTFDKWISDAVSEISDKAVVVGSDGGELEYFDFDKAVQIIAKHSSVVLRQAAENAARQEREAHTELLVNTLAIMREIHTPNSVAEEAGWYEKLAERIRTEPSFAQQEVSWYRVWTFDLQERHRQMLKRLDTAIRARQA